MTRGIYLKSKLVSLKCYIRAKSASSGGGHRRPAAALSVSPAAFSASPLPPFRFPLYFNLIRQGTFPLRATRGTIKLAIFFVLKK